MEPLPTPEIVGEDLNPYAPPKADVSSSAAPITGIDMDRFGPAGGGKRFLNYLIDQAGQLGCIFVVSVGLIILEEFGLFSGISVWIENMSDLQSYGVAYVGSLVYFTLFEYLFGRTPAKWITGTKVVTHTGGKPDFMKVILRTLYRIVPFEPFSFLGGNTSGWHDRWSGTLVVDLRNPMPARISPALARHYR
jgi:uncharacterized RDD family membrane protein YckC